VSWRGSEEAWGQSVWVGWGGGGASGEGLRGGDRLDGKDRWGWGGCVVFSSG